MSRAATAAVVTTFAVAGIVAAVWIVGVFGLTVGLAALIGATLGGGGCWAGWAVAERGQS